MAPKFCIQPYLTSLSPLLLSFSTHQEPRASVFLQHPVSGPSPSTLFQSQTEPPFPCEQAFSEHHRCPHCPWSLDGFFLFVTWMAFVCLYLCLLWDFFVSQYVAKHLALMNVSWHQAPATEESTSPWHRISGSPSVCSGPVLRTSSA